MSSISVIEVVEQIRKGLSGEVNVTLFNELETWRSSSNGKTSFWFGDWIIGFSNDASFIDSVLSVVAGDGRAVAEGDELIADYDGCPVIDELSVIEIVKLEQILWDIQ